MPALARQLGVQADALREAVQLYRTGSVSGAPQVSALVSLDVELPTTIFHCLANLAFEIGMSPGQLVRATLHAVMRGARSPTPRFPSVHEQARPRERIRGIVFRDQVLTAKGDTRRHVFTTVSHGLYVALEQRAAAGGVSRARYVLLWLADLVDGLLGDVAIEPIESGQMFESPERYCLAKSADGSVKLPERLRPRRRPPRSSWQWQKIPEADRRRKRSGQRASVVAVARSCLRRLRPLVTRDEEPTAELAVALG